MSEKAALALVAVKAVHTAIFAMVGASVAAIAWDGVRQRPGRRTLAAAAIALGETAVFVGNGFTCPLTPLAVRLGAERGSVADIYLPGWFARRLPVIAGTALLAGLTLNALALARSRQCATPAEAAGWRSQPRRSRSAPEGGQTT